MCRLRRQSPSVKYTEWLAGEVQVLNCTVPSVVFICWSVVRHYPKRYIDDGSGISGVVHLVLMSETVPREA